MTMHPELKKLYIYMLGNNSPYCVNNIRVIAEQYLWYTIHFLPKGNLFDINGRLINDYVTLVPND